MSSQFLLIVQLALLFLGLILLTFYGRSKKFQEFSEAESGKRHFPKLLKLYFYILCGWIGFILIYTLLTLVF